MRVYSVRDPAGELNLNRVSAATLESNIPAQTVLQAAGFREEGRACGMPSTGSQKPLRGR